MMPPTFYEYYLLLASQSLADEAAKKVTITYTDCKTPIVTVKDAIEAKSFFSDQIVSKVYGDPDGEKRRQVVIIIRLEALSNNQATY